MRNGFVRIGDRVFRAENLVDARIGERGVVLRFSDGKSFEVEGVSLDDVVAVLGRDPYEIPPPKPIFSGVRDFIRTVFGL